MDGLGHTYIPKVLPGSSSYEISSPAVGYLMSHYLINKKKNLCEYIYQFFFSPGRLEETCEIQVTPKLPGFPCGISIKGVYRCTIKGYLHHANRTVFYMLDFGVHEKDFCMNRVMSLLSKSEMSSVSSKAKEAISCRPLGVGGGGDYTGRLI